MTLLQKYNDALRSQGYRPQIQDGHVSFQHEGGTFVIPVDDADPDYLRLVFPNFWSIDSDAERHRVLAAAAHVTAEVKGVKVFPIEGNTWAAVELFLPGGEGFAAVLPRCLRAIQSATQCFVLCMVPALSKGLPDIARAPSPADGDDPWTRRGHSGLPDAL